MATSTLQFNAPVATSSASLSDYATAFVDSITGTANQVVASAGVGNVTLSLPQSIGTGSTPTFAGGIFTSTAHSLRVPRMTTTQRDALTPVKGDIIYNTSLDKFQGYDGAWTSFE